MISLRNFILKSKLGFFLLATFLLNCTPEETKAQVTDETVSSKKIKIALLLDTSNSMDGLINQAKSQLWSLVNELAKAECDGKKPLLQIALYEYGNDRLPASENYIRLVTPLTDDLDKISKDLFSLTTNGGSEFCGAVIGQSLKELDWSPNETDLQVIFIAGNEPFTQGSVSYTQVCKNAQEKRIVVNTIFCGDFNEGVNSSWQHGAQLTGGSYMSIDHNKISKQIETPYDDKIVSLNAQLNKTYIAYGTNASYYEQNQAIQDQNAEKVNKEVLVKRSVSKSSSYYKKGAEKWDLVSKSESDKEYVASVPSAELPEEMKTMSKDEKVKFVETKKVERESIENQIAELNKERENYIRQHSSKEDDLLENVLINSIRQQAKTKNIVLK